MTTDKDAPDEYSEPGQIPDDVTAVRDRDGHRLDRDHEHPDTWWASWDDNYDMTTDELWFPVTRYDPPEQP